MNFFIMNSVVTYGSENRCLLEHAGVETGDRFKAQDGEDDDASVDGRTRVANGEDQGVLDAIVARRVVAAERDQRTEANVERVKDLNGGFQPNGWI